MVMIDGCGCRGEHFDYVKGGPVSAVQAFVRAEADLDTGRLEKRLAEKGYTVAQRHNLLGDQVIEVTRRGVQTPSLRFVREWHLRGPATYSVEYDALGIWAAGILIMSGWMNLPVQERTVEPHYAGLRTLEAYAAVFDLPVRTYHPGWGGNSPWMD